MDYYDPDGNPISLTDFTSGIRASTWEREHLDTEIEGGHVSTVWLGLDHAFHDDGPPLIFETMAFVDGPLDNHQERYSTRAAARAGHARMIERVKVERAAWRELIGDERVSNCTRVAADALTSHMAKYADTDYGLGDRFADLMRDIEAAS
jgi:hypothetical protein